RHVGVESNLNATGTKFSERKVRERFSMQFRNNALATMQEDNANRVAPKAWVETTRTCQQIVDRSRNFNSAEPAPDDGDREQPPALDRIGFHRSFFELADQVVGQEDGITQGLQRIRVRAQTWNNAEIYD